MELESIDGYGIAITLNIARRGDVLFWIEGTDP